AVATPANVADSTVLPDLLHGNETRVWGDQAYRGQRAAIQQHAPKAQDFVNRRYRHRGIVDEVERAKNRTKSAGQVEHSIGVIKRVFGFAKVRYRGLNKNAHRLLVTCALANLFMACAPASIALPGDLELPALLQNTRTDIQYGPNQALGHHPIAD